MKYRPKALDGRTLRTCNAAENEVIQELTKMGYTVYNRGWPDLLAVKGDEIKMYEVKSRTMAHFKPCQAKIANVLRKAGFSVEILAPAKV